MAETENQSSVNYSSKKFYNFGDKFFLESTAQLFLQAPVQDDFLALVLPLSIDIYEFTNQILP
jgi:hypothetical protein